MAVIKIARTVALDAPILTEALHGTLFTTEGQAHEFTIHCTQGGAAVTLSGTVTAKFIREESGDTILISGSLSSGAAKVTLPADCYHRSGRFSLTVFVTSGSVATVVYACTGTVKAAEDGTLIDEGTITPSYEEILQQLAGKVSKGGDTMTGALLIKQDSNYPTLGLVRANGTRGVWIQPNVSGDARMSILQYNADATHYEQYRLPALDNGLTSNPGYDILTTKDVRIWNGTGGDDGLAGAVVHDAGMYNVMAYDTSDRTHYWYGFVAKADSQNPIITVLANNVITVRTYNSYGSLYFSGATSYAFKAIKIV